MCVDSSVVNPGNPMEEIFIITVVLVFSPLLVGGCGSAKYTPPVVVHNTRTSLSRVFDHPFDSTWLSVIQYVGTSPFHIDHFEKASGLVTLSFASTNPSELITGGHLESKGKHAFSGDYVDFLVGEADGFLQGSVNIIVMNAGINTTRVTVKATYNFTATMPEDGTYTWSFDTGGSDTRIVTNGLSSSCDTVTMVPTSRTEHVILDEIAKIQ